MRVQNINFRLIRNNKSNAVVPRLLNKNQQYINVLYTLLTSPQKLPRASLVNQLTKNLYELVLADCKGTLILFPKTSQEELNKVVEKENEKSYCDEDLEDEEHPEVIYLDSEAEIDEIETLSTVANDCE